MDPAAIFRLDFQPGPWGPDFLLWTEKPSCWAVHCIACDEWFFDGGRFADPWWLHSQAQHTQEPIATR